MKKEEFIEMYAIQFMASYAASIWDDVCMKGEHYLMTQDAVIDDAYHLAEKVWNKKQEL